MCGMFGIIFCKDLVPEQFTLARSLFMALAVTAMKRGASAAGFAHILKDGSSTLVRNKLSVMEQLQQGEWNDELMRLGPYTSVLMGHTRQVVTRANTINYAHPFKILTGSNPLTGTYNGRVHNYRELSLLKETTRDQAAFSLFLGFAMRNECQWAYLLSQLNGPYCFVLQRCHRIYFARKESPCVYAFINDLNALVYASTETMITDSCNYTNIKHMTLPQPVVEGALHILNLQGKLLNSTPVVQVSHEA